MKKFLVTTAALLFAATPVLAQPGPDNHGKPDDHAPAMAMHGPAMAMHGPSHVEWKKGGHIARTDWGRGVHVDYRAHHLKAPPRGYEWREVDGNFVLAAAATGLIASIILASH